MGTKDSLKKCPFCAEDIKLDAIYCRWCHKDIEKTSSTKSPWEDLYDGEYKWQTSSDEHVPPLPKRKEKSFRFWVIAAATVVSLAFVGFVSSAKPGGFNLGLGSHSSETYKPTVASLCKQVKLYSDNISEAFSSYENSTRDNTAIEELVSDLRSLASRVDSYRNLIPEASSYDSPRKADKLYFVLVGYANDTTYLADAIEIGETSTVQTWFDSLNQGNATYDAQCVSGN